MSLDDNVLALAKNGDAAAFGRVIAPHRRELLALCYRMSGSLHDAEELLQDSLVRAWSGLARFEERSSLRTWLYRVTTHVCLDALEKRSARVLPQDLSPANGVMLPPRLEPIWLEPAPAWLADSDPPDAVVGKKQSVALAFLIALQRLPARQRVVLLLRDVVGYEAKECADLLDATVASVNSALQRARDTLSAHDAAPDEPNDETRALLDRYVRAWESADVNALVSLLREDATLAMPPLPAWLSGARAIGDAVGAMVLVPGSAGVFRLVATEANGLPAFAAYARGDDGAFHPQALHLVETRGGRIAHITAFADPSLFALLGLPATT